MTWEVHDPRVEFLHGITEARDDGVNVLPGEVWLALGDATRTSSVFEGLLARVERRTPATVFYFYDRSFPMRRTQVTQFWKGVTDLQILEQIAKRHGLRFVGTDKPVSLDKHKSLKQEGRTDWDFARERAEEIGVVLYVRGDTLFAKEAAKTNATNPLEIDAATNPHIRTSAFEFRTPENQEGRARRVGARASTRDGLLLKGASDENKRGRETLMLRRDAPLKTKQSLDRRAQAKKDLNREHSYTGNVTLLGDFAERRPDVRDTVKVTNYGRLFSGLYLVDNVNHEFAAGVLESELRLYRDIKAA